MVTKRSHILKRVNESQPIYAYKRYAYKKKKVYEPFHDVGLYHIEASPMICSANQWTGFYMIETSIMKEWMKTAEPYEPL